MYLEAALYTLKELYFNLIFACCLDWVFHGDILFVDFDFVLLFKLFCHILVCNGAEKPAAFAALCLYLNC